MKTQLYFLARLFLFWILFYCFQRLLFIVHFFSNFSGNYTDVLQVPFHALVLDFSAFGYTMGGVFLLSVFNYFIYTTPKNKQLNKIIHIYFLAIALIASLIMAGEITTYVEWRTKLSPKIYLHFNTPLEVFRTAGWGYSLWFLFYVLVQFVFIYVVYFNLLKGNKLQLLKHEALKKRFWAGSTYLLSVSFVFVMLIRGGLQQIPVSTSSAYFSKQQIVNDVSVNSVWNFMNMTYRNFKVDLSVYYQSLEITQRNNLRNSMYETSKNDTVHILNASRPNIILVTLEGWSAQLIEPLGGLSGITPNFNQACQEGLLFTEIYATGGTSETGIVSIISGYQTLSGISISTQSAKCRKLPSVNQSLKEVGYNSFYTFGGSLAYGNIGGYLADVGFDKVVDEDDLNLSPKGKLGIHDEAMFPYFLTEIKKAKSPYFYGLFTQSTHAPYDMAATPLPNYKDDKYITSMVYADSHLGLFLDELKKLPDYANTLVVLIADHGRTNLMNQDAFKEDYFHIPLLITGGALKNDFRGKEISKIGSQADLAKTLLNQMQLPTDSYLWSKDLLNPSTKEWAICTSTLSYGWKNADGYTVYDMISENLIDSPYKNIAKTDSVLMLCRAVLESVYAEYENF